MIKLKQIIDYLFWKRTWFRLIFVLSGALPIAITVLLCYYKYIIHLDDAKGFCMAAYLILFVIALFDTDDVDSPVNPFKKKIQ